MSSPCIKQLLYTYSNFQPELDLTPCGKGPKINIHHCVLCDNVKVGPNIIELIRRVPQVFTHRRKRYERQKRYQELGNIYTYEQLAKYFKVTNDVETYDEAMSTFKWNMDHDPIMANIEFVCCQVLGKMLYTEKYLSVGSRMLQAYFRTLIFAPDLLYVIQATIILLVGSGVVAVKQLSSPLVARFVRAVYLCDDVDVDQGGIISQILRISKHSVYTQMVNSILRYGPDENQFASINGLDKIPSEPFNNDLFRGDDSMEIMIQKAFQADILMVSHAGEFYDISPNYMHITLTRLTQHRRCMMTWAEPIAETICSNFKMIAYGKYDLCEGICGENFLHTKASYGKYDFYEGVCNEEFLHINAFFWNGKWYESLAQMAEKGVARNVIDGIGITILRNWSRYAGMICSDQSWYLPPGATGNVTLLPNPKLGQLIRWNYVCFGDANTIVMYVKTDQEQTSLTRRVNLTTHVAEIGNTDRISGDWSLF
jgi:hypothetical protein